MEKGMLITNQGQDFLYIIESFQQLKRVEFVSDRMSYITLKGRWCNIIVLIVHAPTKDKGDAIKDSFSEELGIRSVP
jgi:hypothetical protein